jgi:predicted nuclease of predicted toxin-antitoxin system
MNFLLDQSTDARLVPWLTERGHNARRIGRDYPHGLPDEQVLAIAQREGRILITDDRDFGELVFRHRQPHTGVIYLRLASYSFALTTARLEAVLTHYADRLDRFLVVTPGDVRERRE